MELTEWDARWRNGQIGFHQPDVSDFLDEYADRVFGAAASGRVLVPLCGKSLDMVFLAQRAAAVVGVEYVEQAVEEFFAERGLSPDVDRGPPVLYRAHKYIVFATDFFTVTNEHVGEIDAIFDRASLVALDPEARVDYVDHLRSLVPAGAMTLLITFDYEQSEMNGPPFAVSDNEVERLFRDGFAIEHLETRDALNERFRARGLRAMTESAFALTRL